MKYNLANGSEFIESLLNAWVIAPTHYGTQKP